MKVSVLLSLTHVSKHVNTRALREENRFIQFRYGETIMSQ